MKPTSKAEASWLTTGYEARKKWQQGTGAARTARRFTRKQLNKARRANDSRATREALDER